MKMLKKMIIAMVLVGSVFAGNSFAAEYSIGNIDINQMNAWSQTSTAEVYYSGRVVIRFNHSGENWGTCAQGYAFLPANGSEDMKAIILTSMTSGLKVNLQVSSSHKISDLCEVNYVMLVGK